MTVSTLITDYLAYGAHADRPATPPTPTGGAAIYYETDTDFAFVWDGAAWQRCSPDMVGDSGSGGTRGLVPAPASGDAAAGKFLKADGTWAVPSGGGGGGSGLFNQTLSATPTRAGIGMSSTLGTGHTITDGDTGVTISSPDDNTSTVIRGIYKTSPSTPYTITALVSRNDNTTRGVAAMLGWYDGTKLQTLYLGSAGTGVQNQLAVVNWSDVNTFSANAAAGAALNMGRMLWMRIIDDGTNVKFQFSIDGSTFIQLYTIAKASGYLGSSGYSSVGFFTKSDSGGGGFPTVLGILSYDEA